MNVNQGAVINGIELWGYSLSLVRELQATFCLDDAISPFML